MEDQHALGIAAALRRPLRTLISSAAIPSYR